MRDLLKHPHYLITKELEKVRFTKLVKEVDDVVDV
jgi:hypothetical protein